MRRTTIVITGVITALSLGLGPSAASARSLPEGAQPPGAPTHLRATVADGHVTLHWRAPATSPTAGSARDYLVIWMAPPVMPLTALVDTHSPVTDYSSTFGAGTYEVEAKNARGTSPPSAPVTVAQNTGPG
jgi:hypothetical protein